MSKTYLLTGGTGFFGPLLAIDLIKSGSNVIFLGRSKDGQDIKDRIYQKLSKINNDIEKKDINVIEYDVREEFDLSSIKINLLENKIDGIWHLAANLSFNKKHKEKVFSTNINGLENILNLASKICAPVYYVSTAYIHGQRSGKIFENELIRPSKFNNYYEESKFLAEKIIKKWGEDNSKNKFIVFRPSILVDRINKYTTNFGYYSFVLAIYKLKNKILDVLNHKTFLFKILGIKKEKDKIYVPLPFPYSEHSLLNLMPVDTAIQWMLHIEKNKNSLNKTFHITNPNPFPMKKLLSFTLEKIGLRLNLFRAPKWFSYFYFSVTKIIGFFIYPVGSFARVLSAYKYYMIEYNVYDTTNTRKAVGEELYTKFDFNISSLSKIIDHFKEYISINHNEL